jgi:alpha-1,3-mannosyltransferase
VSQFGWPEAADQFEAVYMRVLGRSKRRVGRVAIDVLDEDSAIAIILENATNERSRMFTFCNAHTVNLATSDSNLRQALQDAIVLNDGIGVDVASRMLFGSPFPSNLNGTDLIPKLLASAELPLRVYFLGGKPGVAKAAAREVARRYPRVTVAGTCHGYFDAVDSASVVPNIQRSKANLILVAMGQPRQEIWASENFRQFSGPVICVGALFDFLAGEVSRAPSWMRQRRIEWVFRLLNEPRRLGKRYLIGNAVFLMRVVRQRWFGTRL